MHNLDLKCVHSEAGDIWHNNNRSWDKILHRDDKMKLIYKTGNTDTN